MEFSECESIFQARVYRRDNTVALHEGSGGENKHPVRCRSLPNDRNRVEGASLPVLYETICLKKGGSLARASKEDNRITMRCMATRKLQTTLDAGQLQLQSQQNTLYSTVVDMQKGPSQPTVHATVSYAGGSTVLKPIGPVPQPDDKAEHRD